jgi:hypothetical protein
LILDVLKSKHPSIRLTEANADGTVDGFETYGGGAPMTVPHVSSDENIEGVGGKIQGGPGPSGVDARMMSSLLLRYGSASENLRKEVSLWSEWLSNESPQWAAIRALNAKRGVAVDKVPGTRPVHVGEALMRLLGKDLLSTAGDEAKQACGSVHLCAGLEAGVEGGIHAAREVFGKDGWTQDDGIPGPHNCFRPLVDALESNLDIDAFDDEIWDIPEIESTGMSLFDARNGFNELKRYQMLWNVHHLWPKGSRLAFNTYRHFNLVIVRRGGGKLAHVIRSEDGLSQGDPLAMALYDVALLPLGEKLRRAVPGATLPTFADDVAAVGNVVSCARSLEFLSEVGPIYGYFPEPEKTHVICKEEDELEAKVAFLTRGLDVKYSRGQRYLGGFIGRKKERDEWVSAKAEEWANGVRILAGIARKYPQTAYAGLTMSLQAEWQYVARTVPEIGVLFEPVERAIREAFLPILLGVESISADMRQLLSQGVKQAGLGIKNPVDCAQVLHDTSKQACNELVSSLKESTQLWLAQHKKQVREAGYDARMIRLANEEG